MRLVKRFWRRDQLERLKKSKGGMDSTAIEQKHTFLRRAQNDTCMGCSSFRHNNRQQTIPRKFDNWCLIILLDSETTYWFYNFNKANTKWASGCRNPTVLRTRLMWRCKIIVQINSNSMLVFVPYY